MRAPAYLQPALERAHPPAADLDRLAVDRDPVAPRPDLSDQAAVGLPAVAQLDGARRGRVGLGPAAPGEREQARARGAGLRVASSIAPQQAPAACRTGKSRLRCRRSSHGASSPRPASSRSAGEQDAWWCAASTTTIVSAARGVARDASGRSRPQGDQLDISQVRFGRDHDSPSATPVSIGRGASVEGPTARSGPAGGSRSPDPRRLRRSIAWPDLSGGSPSSRPAAATCAGA